MADAELTVPEAPEAFTSVLLEGKEAKALIACNQKLHSLGIGSTINVPRIVVLGDQSTGKSSLLESISKVTLPKAKGTCTKCPIAISISNGPSSDSPWKCAVAVEEIYAFNVDFAGRNATEQRPLGPWEARSDLSGPEIIGTSRDRKELCDLISKAQERVLKPAYKIGNVGATSLHKQERFSPNAVVLNIECGGWPNLSFIDLPGVVSRGGGRGDKYVKLLVHNLVKSFVSDSNNILLLTIPMNHDDDNSAAGGIVEDEEAQSRTMAVFTKPDAASEGQRNDCITKYFAHDRDSEFGFGNHVVMLAGMTPETAELALDEATYFSTDVWRDLKPSPNDQLGVTALTQRLAKLLFDKTRDSLPTSLLKIELRLDQLQNELKTIPPPPHQHALPYQLETLLQKFDKEIQASFNLGSTPRKKLRDHISTFFDSLEDARPTLKYKTDQELEEQADAQRALVEDVKSEPLEIEHDADEVGSKHSYQFTLQKIYELNQTHCQSNIAGQIEPKAVDEMNKISVAKWNSILDTFLLRVHKWLRGQIIRCITDVFSQQQKLPLFNVIIDRATGFLDDVYGEEKVSIHRECLNEQSEPLTVNEKLRLQYERQELKARVAERTKARLEVENVKLKQQAIGCRKAKPIEEKDLPDDEWETELQMLAKTAAYYAIAAPRFADSVSIKLYANLIPRCAGGLVTSIKPAIGLGGTIPDLNTISLLMTEDHELQRYRQGLVDEQYRLIEGRRSIKEVFGVTDGLSMSIERVSSAETPQSTGINVKDENNDDVMIIERESTIAPSVEPSTSSTPKPASAKRKAGREDMMGLDATPTKKRATRSNTKEASEDYGDLVNRQKSINLDE